MARNCRETIYGDVSAHFVEVRLADLCDSDAGIQTGPFGSQLHQRDYVLVGTPIITVEHLGENRVLHEGLPHVSVFDRDRLSRYSLRAGDIVFSRVGSVDRRAIVRPAEDGWLFSGRCLRVRPRPDAIDSLFLSYFFGLPAFKEHIRAIAVGATMPSLNTSILSDVLVPHPPSLSEQCAIANILGTLDDKIELNRKMNVTLEAMARALFKSWFVDFDPVRAKAEGRDTGLPAHITALFPDSFEDTELGEIPTNWRATTLGAETERHCGRIQTGPFGSQLHASDYSAEGVPVVMPQDISNRRASTTRIARIKESDAERLSRHRLETGDIIYSRRGDVERHAQISIREAGWLCGTGCLLVRMGPRWPSSMFMSLALDRPESKAWITQHAIGATMPNLNTGILSAVPVVVPPEALLRAFAKLVDPMEQLISAKNSEVRTLATLRDTLLPKLISGELRVTEAERIAEGCVE